MNRPRYESRDEARSSLEDRVSHELMDDAFEAVETATRELVDEYELDGEVDADEVQKWVKIGWCENAVIFIDDGVWKSESDVREVIDSIRLNPVSNAMTIAGVVARRNQDMMRVSNAILKRKYSRGR